MKSVPKKALLSIEFTYQVDFGGNVIARNKNVVYPAIKGIPTFITMPESSVALRGNERLGNRNEKQQEWERITYDVCKRLVEANESVTYATVSADLARSDLPLDAINEGSWKMDLMMAVVGDTWNVAASVINLPESVVYFPDKWKLAGCQLTSIYELVRCSMKVWLEEKRRVKNTDGAVNLLRRASEEKNIQTWSPHAQSKKVTESRVG